MDIKWYNPTLSDSIELTHSDNANNDYQNTAINSTDSPLVYMYQENGNWEPIFCPSIGTLNSDVLSEGKCICIIAL